MGGESEKIVYFNILVVRKSEKSFETVNSDSVDTFGFLSLQGIPVEDIHALVTEDEAACMLCEEIASHTLEEKLRDLGVTAVCAAEDKLGSFVSVRVLVRHCDTDKLLG